MTTLRILALVLLVSSRLIAIDLGADLEAVIEEKGEPSSRMQFEDTLILSYPGETIKLRDGKVISITTPVAERSTKDRFITEPGDWTTSYVSAVARAKSENRRLFLFFTGSDWCGWCKRLDREVLSTPVFWAYAEKNFVLVKVDFPKEIPQSSRIKEQNRQLQRKYQVEGYPTVIILDSSGKVLGRMGYRPGGPRPFIDQLKQL